MILHQRFPWREGLIVMVETARRHRDKPEARRFDSVLVLLLSNVPREPHTENKDEVTLK